MSLKSKRNREKRKRERRQNYLKSLKRKSEMGILDAEEIAFGLDGYEKMSEVLTEFIAPYSHLADTEDAYQKLLTLAVMAWNVCLLPVEKQRDMVAKVIAEGLPENDLDTKAGLIGILGTLMARKRTFFPDNKRFILSFELTETETGFHLLVLSSLDAPPT